MNLILLRGLGRECAHWHGFVELLQHRVAGAESALCVDLPGVGTARKQRSPLSVPGIVDQVRRSWQQRMGQATAGEPWVVVGISLGGMVALEWAHQYPDEVCGIVAMNSSAGRCSLPWHRMRLSALFALARAAMSRDLPTRERHILEITSELRAESSRELMAQRLAIARERPVRPGVVLAQILAASRFRGPRRLAAPCLLLLGERDRLAHPSCSRNLARQLGAELRSCPDAGHDLNLDQPRWAADQIADWLETSFTEVPSTSADMAPRASSDTVRSSDAI